MTDNKGDLISRSALKQELTYLGWTEENGFKNRYVLDDIIDKAPAVEVRDGYDLGYVKGLEDGKAKAEAVEYEYITVRSYTDGCNTTNTRLYKALANGYEFVRASEVVKNSKDYSDYIEYILRRRKQNG